MRFPTPSYSTFSRHPLPWRGSTAALNLPQVCFPLLQAEDSRSQCWFTHMHWHVSRGCEHMLPVFSSPSEISVSAA